jgi:hypothetical protein
LGTGDHDVIRTSLPYSPRNPSEQLLRLKFMNLKLGIQDTVTGPSGLDELMGIWQEANGINDTNEPIPALLAVDAVAFCPTITLGELGKVEGIQGTDQLERVDLYAQLLTDPVAFQDFVKENINHADTSLFVYQT